VQGDDSVLHLRGVGRGAAFVGFSTAAQDGHVTTERARPTPGSGRTPTDSTASF